MLNTLLALHANNCYHNAIEVKMKLSIHILHVQVIGAAFYHSSV